jgi:hypothetical protein
MLRDVVIHLYNEQPLQADLITEPVPTDTVALCRNLRTMNGKKPGFIDRSDSTFVIPYAHIRFVEIRKSAIAALEAEKAAQAETGRPGPAEDGIQEVRDADLLRRVRDA